MLLNQFWIERLEREKSKCTWNTITKHHCHRRKVFGYAPEIRLDEIDLKWILSFESHLREIGNGTNTVGSVMSSLKSTLRQAVDQELILKDPFGKYKIRQAPTFERALDIEHIKKLEAYKPRGKQTKRYVDVWLFSFYCAGIRIGDLCRMKIENVANGRLEYSMNKNGKRVSMPMSEKAQYIATQYTGHALRNERQNLFGLLSDDVSDDQLYMDIKRVVAAGNRAFKAPVADLSLPHMTWHAARAAFATYMVREGTDIDTVRQLLKHSSILTTQAYLASRSNDQLGDVVSNVMDF